MKKISLLKIVFNLISNRVTLSISFLYIAKWIYDYINKKQLLKTDTAQQRRRIHFQSGDKKRFFYHSTGLVESQLDLVLHFSKFIVNEKGTIFHLQRWSSQNDPKAIVCFIHGYGTNALDNYEFICRGIASKGFTVYAMDGYGHGLSDGSHGFIPSFKDYVDDYLWSYTEISKSAPDKKCFLFAVSMGGTVAIKLLNQDVNQKLFSGAILVSPMCKISVVEPDSFKVHLVKFLSHILPTAKIIPRNYRSKTNFRNKETENHFNDIKICYRDNFCLKTGVELNEGCQKIGELAGSIEHPLIILHGDDDSITCPKSSKDFFDSVSSKDKEWRIYEKENHFLMFENYSGEVFNEITDWLLKRSIE